VEYKNVVQSIRVSIWQIQQYQNGTLRVSLLYYASSFILFFRFENCDHRNSDNHSESFCRLEAAESFLLDRWKRRLNKGGNWDMGDQ
jgi:hypothetical protein